MKVIFRKNALLFECPAQECGLVRIPLEGEPKWKWNGSVDNPTLSPSVRITWDFGEPPNVKHNQCHFVIENGIIKFDNDCTHELKGQKVPMLELAEDFLQFHGID